MFRLVASISILFSVASAFAQNQNPFQNEMQFDSDQSQVRGQIIAAAGARLDNFMVELTATNGNGVSQKVRVSRTGDFNFDAVSGASYFLRVWDNTGNIVSQQIVTANPMASVEINLSQSNESRPITGTISLYELQHKVPSNALKEGRQADKYAAKRDMKSYIEHAQKAVALDPDWTVARRNLGIGYLLEGDNDKAVEQFQEVLKRDPRSVPAQAALSAAYLQMNKYKEAESSARRALNLDSTSEPGRYYLGLSLALQRKDDLKALQYLEKVSGHFPKAHLACAEIMERMGMKAAAKGQLEEYLSSGNSDARTQVKAWLSSLN